MVKAEGSVVINAPAEKIYDLLTATERLPEWMPLLIEVSDIQGEGVGQSFSWKYKFIGITFKGRSEIVERVENKKSVVNSTAGIESEWTWDLTQEGNGTKVGLVVEYTIPVPVLGKFAEPFVVKQGTKDIQHTLDTFKNLLEA
jgi:uncharacterized membrane protein